MRFTCYCGEKVGGCLAVHAIPSLVDEVLFCPFNWAKVDLTAFIQNHYFIEDCIQGYISQEITLVNSLTSLINRHDGGLSEKVRYQTERLGKLERRGRIKTTRTVVPTSENRMRAHLLISDENH